MDSLAAVKRQYEDFEPSIEWVPEEDCNTLLLFLPGFRKNQLRVQVTTNRKLRISGMRSLGDEKWSRFQNEFQISENCDTNGITAKFEGDILYIRQPKVITPAAGQEKARPTSEAPKTDHKPADEQYTQKNSSDGQEHAPQQVTSSMPATIPDPTKQTNRPKDDDWIADANNDISQTKIPQKEKEQEKQLDATNGKSSSVSSDVKNDSQNEAILQKEKSDELVEAGKDTNAIKHEKLSDYADKMKGADRDKNLNQINSCVVMEMKKRRKLFNFVMAALLLALAFGVYATSWIGAYKK